jgi:hypothetical protein
MVYNWPERLPALDPVDDLYDGVRSEQPCRH